MAEKVVIVTGAGRGTGRVIAEMFLESGACVAASDLRVPDWESPYEDRLLRVACDVSSEEAVVSLVEETVKAFGGVDVLVNNAGISIGGPVVDDTVDIYHKVLGINIIGTFLCTREVIKRMYAANTAGRIINIASIAGKNAFANSSAYSASKAGVIGFTRSLALECAPRGITVNAICPGSVDTPMLYGVIQKIMADTGNDLETTRYNMQQLIPLRRFQTPKDIASLCLFLASDGAANINGESINLDGGMVRD